MIQVESNHMSTWCWPCPPKSFNGPSKYDLNNISSIPTGSLYFASRKGPLSEANARITGSPYDMTGIVFQSKTQGREGTYIFTVDSTFVKRNNDSTVNNVVVINLADLIRDDSILHHGVLPLKDFDDAPYPTPEIRSAPEKKNPMELIERKYQAHQRMKEIARGEEEKGVRAAPPMKEKEKEKYADCKDVKEWKAKLRQVRNEVLKELFKKYRDLKPQHDAYQTLASMVGIPASDAIRNKNTFTAAELVGLILFQAGLIWDDRFDTGDRNPVCCFDKCFFQKLSEGDRDQRDAIVALCTPKTHASVKYNHEYKVRQDKTRNYPDLIYKRPNKKEVKIDSPETKKVPPPKGPKGCKDDVDRDTRYNLREYLENTFNSGYYSQYISPTDGEKGGPEEDESYCDYYGCKDHGDYKRCSYPAKWNKSNDCYDRTEGYPKPICKDIYARTIFFGSLRPCDFLTQKYFPGDDSKKMKPLIGRPGAAGELIALIHELAEQRSNVDGSNDQMNRLNLCWFHQELIPIEINNNPDADCHHRIEAECRVLKDLVSKLDNDLIQKKMQQQDNTSLDGGRLLYICKRVSELSAELHSIANDCDTQVKTSTKRIHVNKCDDDDHHRGDYKFKVQVNDHDKYATEYVMVVHKYMWGKDWVYEWDNPLRLTSTKYHDLCCRMKRLIQDLEELKTRTPVSCIILELIMCLWEQAQSLYRHICACSQYCIREDLDEYEEKGGEENADEVINECCEEK